MRLYSFWSTRTCLYLISVITLPFGSLWAQNIPRFWQDVQTIQAYDKVYPPPPNPILLIGSSSIRLWHDVEQIFASYPVLNRGLGGTVVKDFIQYADEIIFAYNPRQIIIYVGENDLGIGETFADTIFTHTKQLIQVIRQKLPEVPIAYLSIKPSPGRDYARAILQQTNELMRRYISTQKNMSYVDVYSKMIHRNGSYRSELFVQDKIHMTPAGYSIWAKTLKPYLVKNK